ncbi:hypothetical protein [uncultured Rhodoblastus sp.]|uniref:hypothetical protein n=1 Tax=uncultured Rhodoblastus sp. TaxID=543037 RepID=UPI0025EA94DC|nr:hypothetical protein [uncultured Rhodoblastus sp.]
MNGTLARRLWLAAFILLCCVGALYDVWKIRDWGDKLSPVDAYSEANALREVDGFRAQGFWRDAGLGNVLFGPRYPDEGFPTTTGEELEHTLTPSGVYTHYPPGPEYLLYLAEAVLGPEPVSRLRLLPIALGAAATTFFGLSVRRRFGAVAGWLVMLVSLTVVPFSDAYTSIHEFGYALALLLVEIGVAIGRNRLRWPFLLLGFLQGWLSFDQIFLVVLTPLAVELSLPVITPGYDPRWRLAMERCFVAGLGFTFAHLLHFVEVWAYFGSLSAAIADFKDSARWRAANETDMVNGWSGTVIANLGHYFFSRQPFALHLEYYTLHSFRFLRLTLGPAWLLVALGFLAVAVSRIRSGLAAFNLLGRWVLMGLIGVVASSGWYVAMPAHAHHHINLMYRHTILCFELWAIFLAVQAAGPIETWLSGWTGRTSAPTASTA